MKKKMISLLLGGLVLLPVACNTLEQEEGGFASTGNSSTLSHVPAITKNVEPADTTGSEYSTVTVPAHRKKSAGWTGYETRLISGMNWMDKLLVDTRDVWGGYEGVAPEHITSTNPVGFWRTGTYHGRPMFVNPDGNISFLYGMNSVTPDPLSDAAATQTTDYYNDAFSNVEEWADWCAQNLGNIGFNFYCNNSRRIRTYRADIPQAVQTRLRQGNNTGTLSQVENLYLLRTFLWDYGTRTGKTLSTVVASPFVIMWDPDWTDFCYKTALSAAAFFKADPNFIGYFTDNELPFVDTDSTYKIGISLQGWLNLEEDLSEQYGYRCNSYAKAWAQNWMQENYGTTTYNASMEPAFLRAVCEYYYRTTAEAIRAADPNHLVMGSRLHRTAPGTQAIVESCARYHDVVSLNFYGYWDVTSFTEAQGIRAWAAGKPVMATEFYAKNENQTVPGSATPYNNNEGAGWLVQSQTARGQYYQNTVIRFIEEGTFAGWMWFKWTDDYRNTLSGWVNKGLVVPDYSGVYTDCTNLMKTAHWNLYQLLDYYWGASAGGDDLAGDIPEGTWD